MRNKINKVNDLSQKIGEWLVNVSCYLVCVLSVVASEYRKLKGLLTQNVLNYVKLS